MKSYGQIAYEAMLKRVRENKDMPGYSEHYANQTTGDPYLDGVWEAQSERLRADWEEVGHAVRDAVRQRV